MDSEKKVGIAVFKFEYDTKDYKDIKKTITKDYYWNLQEKVDLIPIAVIEPDSLQPENK